MSKPGYSKVYKNEEAYGISVLLSDHRRFLAGIKERYSDFHVNEIDKNGKIIRLTSLNIPRFGEEDGVAEISEELVSVEDQAKIKELREEIRKDKKCKKSVEIKAGSFAKEQRGNVHKWVRGQGLLDSETKGEGEAQVIVVKAGGGNRYKRRPDYRKKYTHCTLYKEGLDTSDAIGHLCRFLRIKPGLITFAGTKDKQAKTCQRICIPNVDANFLMNYSKRSRNAKFGDFEYKDEPLFLGDLSGNHFTILMKNVTSTTPESPLTDEEIIASLESLKNKGFVNYFGLQRFGTFSISTHLIGKAILQNKLSDAFDMILTHKDNDPHYMRKAKELWFQKKDLETIPSIIPKFHRSIESNLLIGISKYYGKNDLQSAFACIHRNMRTFYVHSFQSYLWNNVASRRIKEYGLAPRVGDLIIEEGEIRDMDIQDEGVEEVGEENAGAKGGDGDAEAKEVVAADEAKNGEGAEGGKGGENKVDKSFTFLPKVRELKEEDLANFEIYDIVLPLYGREVIIPKDILKFYDDLLDENGLAKDFFANAKPKCEVIKGAYRKLLVRPTNFDYKISNYYKGENLDGLIKSDLEKVLNWKSKAPKPDEEKERNQKCIIVEFSLPTSAYATMALRECMIDSSITFKGEDSVPCSPTKKLKLTDETETNAEKAEEAGAPEITNVEKMEEDAPEIKGSIEPENEPALV